MKKSILPILTVISFFFVSCGTPEKHTLGSDISGPAQTSAIANTIRMRYKAIVKATEIANADSLVKYFSKSPEFRFVDQEGVMIPSYDSFYNAVRRLYAGGGYQKEKSSTLDVDVLSPVVAVLTSVSRYDAVGTDSSRFSGFAVTTFLFRKEEEEWYVVYTHQSIREDKGEGK
jgi:hypothetical protein